MAENSTSENPANPPEEKSPQLSLGNETLPENPASKNDTSPTENNPDKVGIAEKIRAAGESAVSAFSNRFKKGKGRPKKCRACGDEIGKRENCAKCGGTGVEPGKGDLALPTGGPGAAVAPPVSSDLAARPGAATGEPRPAGSFLLRRVIVSGAKGGKWLSRYILEGKAIEAGLDEAFIEKAFDRAKPSEEMWKNFDESTSLVLQKYNIKTESDELLCFVSDFGALFACDLALFRTFQKEIARKNKKEKAE